MATRKFENFIQLADLYETRYQRDSKRKMQYGNRNLKKLVKWYFFMKFLFRNPKKFLVQSFIEIRQFHDF